MNCYEHPDRPAVGICKNCQKGLCADCAADVGDGLACKDRCEQAVRDINEIVRRSKTAYQKVGMAHRGMATFLALLAFIMAGFALFFFALTDSPFFAVYFAVFAVAFALGAFISVRSGRRIESVDS